MVAIPEKVWTDSERDALGIDTMWDESLRARVEKAAQSERQAWELVQSVKDWEQFRDPRIERIANLAGNVSGTDSAAFRGDASASTTEMVSLWKTCFSKAAQD